MTRLALLVLCLGCVATAHWVHPNGSYERWNRDSYECERDMRQSGYYGGGVSGMVAMQAYYERCLMARGWRQE